MEFLPLFSTYDGFKAIGISESYKAMLAISRKNSKTKKSTITKANNVLIKK
jgi:hypothetical protein